MRYITKILFAITAITALAGCFKDEKQGTALKVAVYTQNTSDDAIVKATDLESYAFYVEKNSKWEVTTWEDALAHRITNTERPAEQLTEPDVMGTFDAEAEYQVRLELWSPVVFAVIVDRANKMYATRLYETPINLPTVDTKLHIYAWKKSGQANGWNVINPFPDEARDPVNPPVDETPTEDETVTE